MAVKKSETSKTSAPATPSKGTRKVVATKAASPKTTTATTATTAKTRVAAATSTKVGTPKAAIAAKPAAKKAAPKGPAPVKLTDRQKDFLKTISEAKEQGFQTSKKAEQKTIDALLDRKLIKRGAKDKTSGSYCYLVSKAGEKHLSEPSQNP